MADKLIYLASPYSHTDKAVMELRAKQVAKFAGYMMKQGLIVFSPIAHGHSIAMEHALPTDFAFWENHCKAFLEVSGCLYVLKLEGWQHSKGVKAEVRMAKKMNLPIYYQAYHLS